MVVTNYLLIGKALQAALAGGVSLFSVASRCPGGSNEPEFMQNDEHFFGNT